MTTKVTVEANHGWPVDVTNSDPKTGLPSAVPVRVPAGASQVFYVHSTQDLIIHEVQPDELKNPDQSEMVLTDKPA